MLFPSHHDHAWPIILFGFSQFTYMLRCGFFSGWLVGWLLIWIDIAKGNKQIRTDCGDR